MIRTEGLHKTFRGRAVLDGVDLAFAVGDRVALVGANGAGKTTLIRCLLGEYTHQGTVTVAGSDPRLARREVLRQVGFVPQLPPPLGMPVGELVHFAARVCDSDPARIEEVAKRLGLDAVAIRAQPFVKLSGGQKQKLLIAIALGRDSRLLIMDEPAANLDPEARHIFFKLLAERKDSATMLLSSHRLDEVAALVTRVVELDQGKVVLDDHVADAVDMTSLLTARLVFSRPEDALAKTLGAWGFQPAENGTVWQGQVAGADRLRFLGTVSRYAGLLRGLSLEEKRP